jgi:DNA-binding NtrC family response regulator
MSLILCIDDEPAVCAVLEDALARLGHQAVFAANIAEGLKAIRQQPFDLIIANYPANASPDLLDLLREEDFGLPVIVMTGYASVEHAVLSMRKGAADYITKPLRFEALRISVTNALEVNRLRRENENIKREITTLRGLRKIVGESRALRGVMDTIETVAPTRATVLLEGESGTGKELFARAIHEASPRRSQPFVTVNCAALPEGLVESTLFGHERGAFTGATVRFMGAFERAHNGTLLLDEISEMGSNLQAKLLRAIQEQEFERVGGSQPIRVSVRIVATTNRDLAAEVESGRFRRDLYYRLSVVPVRTPPLRERIEDIPLLVAHFVEQFAEELGIRPPQVTTETIRKLERMPWPGNIRELANAIERAVILCRSGILSPEAFGVEEKGVTPRAPSGDSATVDAPEDSSERILNLKTLERLTIEKALIETGGHRARAAELLGISERTLRNKLNTRSNGPYDSDSAGADAGDAATARERTRRSILSLNSSRVKGLRT